ncbi:MAG: replication/maintenance protein RepL [Candidatus Heimdallarchaeota archaeon]
MDKFRVIWHLLEDYNKNGAIFSRSAKEIAEITKISLTETYQTLQALTEAGLLWRVGRRNLYRFGLKEKKIPLLDKLHQCIKKNKPLPEELTINLEELEKLAEKKRLLLENEDKEKEIISEINNILNKLEIIPEKICIDKIEETIKEITNNSYKKNDPSENFIECIQEELNEINDYIFGIKFKEGEEI